jgi:hypothetical protein
MAEKNVADTGADLYICRSQVGGKTLRKSFFKLSLQLNITVKKLFSRLLWMKLKKAFWVLIIAEY